MENQNNLNKDFNAIIVKERLFGKSRMSKNIMKNTGLNYGSLKVTVFAS